MAATGFTPIYLYCSSTASNAPGAGNLGDGELAINITDGYLYYKDNANAVQKIGYKLVPIANGGTNNTSFTAKSGNVAGLVFYDGTKLTNDATVTDVGYDTSTNTLTCLNFASSGYFSVANYRGQFTGGTAPASGVGVEIGYSTSGVIVAYDRTTPGYKQLGIYGNPTIFYNQSTEAARIDTNARLQATNAILINSSSLISGAEKFVVVNASADWIEYARNSNAAPYGNRINYSGAAPNGTGNEFLYCDDTGGLRVSLLSNGGLKNYSANNVNIASDIRLKKDVEPIKSYWDVFKNIGWKTWLYNDQTDTIKNIGVIAQELQQLAPELICLSNINAKNYPHQSDEPEDDYIGIWENDFKMAGMSVITELVNKVEQLQQEVSALKASKA